MEKEPTIALLKTMGRITVVKAFLPLIFIIGIFAQKVNGQQELKSLQTNVKGIVTSPQGEPLSGVTVNLKGTLNGTTTDSKGKYEINVSNKAILVFTHIGYLKQEIKVNNESVIDVKFEEENAELTKVVVVGYGTQKKKDLTGTVATVSGKDLQVAPTPNLLNNLAGKLPGVIVTQATGQPGYDEPDFSIRGKSTFG